MRYDSKDGIDYFSLATVGGAQPGWSAQGRLAAPLQPRHRPQRPGCLLRLPRRRRTRTQSDHRQGLRRSRTPGQSHARTLQSTHRNQARRLGWRQLHRHHRKPHPKTPSTSNSSPPAKTAAGSSAPTTSTPTSSPAKEKALTFNVKRAPGPFDTTARAIVLQLGIDLLTDKHRYPIPTKRITVPGSLRVDTD